MGYKSPPLTDEEHEKYLLANDFLREKQRVNNIIRYINHTHKGLLELHEWGENIYIIRDFLAKLSKEVKL